MAVRVTLCVCLIVFLASTEGFFLRRKPRRVCHQIFRERVCFSTDKPYTNSKRKLPESPSKQGVTFELYTPNNPTRPQYVTGMKRERVTSTTLNPRKPTRVIVHGFRGCACKPWVKNMTKELLQRDGSNVIVVNWKNGATKSFLRYNQAVANTRVVGALLASLIKQISLEMKISLSKFHIIGHSLGAHVAGYAGQRLDGGLGRITGLDPAGPSFEKYGRPVRLDDTDAIFVDVVHTNGKSLLKGGFGIHKAIGDADFYPNGGQIQPGCPRKLYDKIKSLFKGTSLKDSFGCSHLRAFELFTESINSRCTFEACGKSGCSEMGFHALPNRRGSFSLTTKSKSPFCVV